jgi:hypothetical protein
MPSRLRASPRHGGARRFVPDPPRGRFSYLKTPPRVSHDLLRMPVVPFTIFHGQDANSGSCPFQQIHKFHHRIIFVLFFIFPHKKGSEITWCRQIPVNYWSASHQGYFLYWRADGLSVTIIRSPASPAMRFCWCFSEGWVFLCGK